MTSRVVALGFCTCSSLSSMEASWRRRRQQMKVDASRRLDQTKGLLLEIEFIHPLHLRLLFLKALPRFCSFSRSTWRRSTLPPVACASTFSEIAFLSALALRTRRRHAALALAAHRAGDVANAWRHAVGAISVSLSLRNFVFRNLQGHQGVVCISAAYEADAQMARLVADGFADAVLTEDGDLLAYQARMVGERNGSHTEEAAEAGSSASSPRTEENEQASETHVEAQETPGRWSGPLGKG
ncbi:XPG I-region protein [Toxoplasma gondii p89]|uniref:XPG I-region protein n=1 Tax=Toxoplasma gondii p89 TaxID=943119 RepID=A0A086J767_TOXGO|nr:XPG I-region protein [Toxoplasma gondii p89]